MSKYSIHIQSIKQSQAFIKTFIRS